MGQHSVNDGRAPDMVFPVLGLGVLTCNGGCVTRVEGEIEPLAWEGGGP